MDQADSDLGSIISPDSLDGDLQSWESLTECTYNESWRFCDSNHPAQFSDDKEEDDASNQSERVAEKEAMGQVEKDLKKPTQISASLNS